MFPGKVGISSVFRLSQSQGTDLAGQCGVPLASKSEKSQCSPLQPGAMGSEATVGQGWVSWGMFAAAFVALFSLLW